MNLNLVKTLFGVIGLLFLAVLVVWVSYPLATRPFSAVIPEPGGSQVMGADPDMPNKEWEDAFSIATVVMQSLYRSSHYYGWWSQCADWVSFFLTAAITVIVGSTGQLLQGAPAAVPAPAVPPLPPGTIEAAARSASACADSDCRATGWLHYPVAEAEGWQLADSLDLAGQAAARWDGAINRRPALAAGAGAELPARLRGDAGGLNGLALVGHGVVAMPAGGALNCRTRSRRLDIRHGWCSGVAAHHVCSFFDVLLSAKQLLPVMAA